VAHKKITIEDITSLDYESVAAKLSSYIRKMVDESGMSGVVLGVSGGVDSATALALAVKALGPEKVLALIMPDTGVTPLEDTSHAKKLVEMYNVDYKILDIKPIVDAYLIALGEGPDKRSVGNLRARIRMSILYLYANMDNLLVMGTGDRSEILLGYFTKYGDGAADFHPLGCLYKSQVRRLALHLGVPKNVALKPSSPRLWPGHMAEDELGLSYEEIDVILYAIFDLGLSRDEAVEATGLEAWKIDRVIELHKKTEHKRRWPPVPDPEEYVWQYRKNIVS
jgi:NAD+ synthase